MLGAAWGSGVGPGPGGGARGAAVSSAMFGSGPRSIGEQDRRVFKLKSVGNLHLCMRSGPRSIGEHHRHDFQLRYALAQIRYQCGLCKVQSFHQVRPQVNRGARQARLSAKLCS